MYISRYGKRFPVSYTNPSNEWCTDDSLMFESIYSGENSNSHILNHRDDIMILLDNDEYDQIMGLLPCIFSLPKYDWIPIENESGISDSLESYSNNLDQNSIPFFDININHINKKLFSYSLDQNDIELLRKIISKTNQTDLFDSITVDKIIYTNNETICRIILDEVHLENSIIELCFGFIIKNQRINLLELFAEYGHTMNINHLSSSIQSGYLDIIKFAIANNYDVQGAFNGCDFKTNKIDFTIFDITININTQMLDLLVDHHIDISAQINNILVYASLSDDLELVKYCIESTYATDINAALKLSYNHKEIMVYLLQSGADINSINSSHITGSDISLVKLLLDHGYQISTPHMRRLFTVCFIYADDISNIQWLFDYGIDSTIIFGRESYMEKNPNYGFNHSVSLNKKYYLLNSYLEHIVAMGKLSHIKFLAETHFDKLQSELDRLFIIAGANGQLDMATYLLDLGANIHAENNMAITVACYFGHLEMVNFLLCRGSDLTSIAENLFMIIINGDNNTNDFCTESATYNKLICNNIFRNDIFHYGKQHGDIINLLIKYNVKIPDHTVFEILPKKFYTKDFFTYLISNGIDIHKKIRMNNIIFCTKTSVKLQSILEASIYWNKIDIVKLLLDNGADLTIINPIIIADSINHTKIKKLLLEYGSII